MVEAALTKLRLQAEEHCRSKEWATLVALRERLQVEDPEWWAPLWGPLCSVAAWHEGLPYARDMLEDVISAGFCQPEFLEDEFAETFAQEADWSELVARMRDNVPHPRLELTAWPTAERIDPDLDRLPIQREEILRGRIPAPGISAESTALSVLEWVTSYWEHANDHVDSRDALEILDRVDSGERFACVEYTAVLSQALNALEIPARTLSLRMDDYHVGFGRAHVATEAWIDDLGRWIVLDGQHGARWLDAEGRALGLQQLRSILRKNETARLAGIEREYPADEAALWLRYFAHPGTVATRWTDGDFSPLFQGQYVVECERLERGDTGMAPDLTGIVTGIADDEGPAAIFTPVHPYAIGVRVTKPGGAIDLDPDQSLRLTSDDIGNQDWCVATRTPYGVLRSHQLSFTVR